MIYILIGWIVCSILTWGMYSAAHAKATYNWLPFDWFQCCYLSLSGPAGFITVLLVGGFRGFRLTPFSKEDSWQAWVDRGWGDGPDDRREFEDWWEGRKP